MSVSKTRVKGKELTLEDHSCAPHQIGLIPWWALGGRSRGHVLPKMPLVLEMQEGSDISIVIVQTGIELIRFFDPDQDAMHKNHVEKP